MHTAVLHIGSNLGNRKSYLSKCKHLISERVGKIIKCSRIYTTEAWGLKDQQSFLNQAFVVETTLTSKYVLHACQEIEDLLGRKRDLRWGPRTIDIDLIFYDDEVLEEPDLTLPHPRMHERNFVLYPLSEIVPEYIHPVLNASIEELKSKSKDLSHVSL